MVLLRRIEPWTIDPDLIGRAEESNILEPQGRIITKLEEIRKLEETFSQNAGVRSNKGFINRLINFPHRTKADAQKLHEKLVETDRYLIELIEAIVPEDGFQKEEEKKIEHAGIKLRLETDPRAKTYQKSDEKLIQVIVNGTDKALVDGHSIIPIKNEIDGLIELVTPRTSEQILHGIVNFEDSAYVGKNGYQDFEFGYDGVSFDKTAKKIREGLSSTPKNPILKIARVLAKIIRHMWVRAILAFLYLWALAVAAFDTVAAIGMPEARIALSQVSIYLALAPKSNSAYLAINSAIEDVRAGFTPAIPLYLRSSASARVGSDKSYVYPHDDVNAVVQQQYLAETREYYKPKPFGQERPFAERLEALRAIIRGKKA